MINIAVHILVPSLAKPAVSLEALLWDQAPGSDSGPIL